MPHLDALTIAAAAATATFVALVVRALARPPRRLAGRVRPYVVAARAQPWLGRADRPAALASPQASASPVTQLFAPILAALAHRVGRHLDGTSEQQLQLRLRQAGMLADVPDEMRVQAFRMRQLGAAAGWAGLGLAAGLVTGQPAGGVLATGALGAVLGLARTRGRLDRAVADRSARMRIELYTINQLLAMHVRVGGGVLQAVARVVDRGHGEVVKELREVLRAHAAGMPAQQALVHAARTTPEPHAARTYRLLATATEYGTDLATALLAHSEDVRDARREALRRAATRRRAAMLLPIIGILAPVMLLFVAAPIPSLVFGAR